MTWHSAEPNVLKALDQLRRTPPTTKNTAAPVPDSVKRRRQAICSETANMYLILDDGIKPSQKILKPSIDFDTLLLEKAELVTLCCEMFECLGLTNKFKVSLEDLRRFVVQVMFEYDFKRHNNTALMASEPPQYHNFIHAVDVTQFIYTLLKTTSAGRLLGQNSQFTLLCAALCHDMGHGGLTNAFLKASNDPLFGMLSSTASSSGLQVGCLERLHANLASKVLRDHFGRSGILNHVRFDENIKRVGPKLYTDENDDRDDDKAQFVHDVVQIILSTDLSNHVAILEKFTEFYESGAYTNQIALLKAEEQSVLVQSRKPDAFSSLQLTSPRLVLLMVLMKVSDISNVARHHSISNKWSERLTNEWLEQVDIERRLGLPPTLNCEVNTPQSRAKSSVGFVDFLAMKCFETLATALPDTSFLVR